MPGSKKKWPVIAGLIFIVGFIAAMMFSTSTAAKFRCEVCIAANGRTVCRDAASSAKEDAERSAKDAACSDLSLGGFACANIDPVSVKWK